MNTDKTPTSSNAKALGMNSDSSKLVSLLALAAGAAAMPQTSNADIIFVNGGGTVSWEGTRSFATGNLPGDVQLGFDAHRTGFFSSTSMRYISGGKRGAGYLQFKLLLVSQPLVWNSIIAGQGEKATFASASSLGFNGNSFSGLYMAFEFKDSTQVGSPMRYGWMQLSLQNGRLSTGNDFPKLTIQGWAYDNSGAQIKMGDTTVPEPSTTALLALGALAFGARGVRSWRRNRGAAN